MMQLSLSDQRTDRECITAHPSLTFSSSGFRAESRSRKKRNFRLPDPFPTRPIYLRIRLLLKLLATIGNATLFAALHFPPAARRRSLRRLRGPALTVPLCLNKP